PARGCYGTNSSAPMSQLAPVGRGSPSKSVVGTPLQVPVSMAGEPELRCMSRPDTRRGSALMLPPRSVTAALMSRTSEESSPPLLAAWRSRGEGPRFPHRMLLRIAPALTAPPPPPDPKLLALFLVAVTFTSSAPPAARPPPPLLARLLMKTLFRTMRCAPA